MRRTVPTHRPRRSTVPTVARDRSVEDAAWRRFIGSAAWRACSEAYRRARPACEWCLTVTGVLVAVEHVHHLRGQDPDASLDWDHLYGLCKSCHSRITLAEQRGEAISYPPRAQLGGAEVVYA